MKKKDLFRITLKSLAAHKLRNTLSLLGIMIGAAGILIIGVIGDSSRKTIIDEIKTFGLNTIWIYRDLSEYRPDRGLNLSSGIEIEDLEAIRRAGRYIARISPVVVFKDACHYGRNACLVKVLYVAPDFQHIENEKVLLGRFLTEIDDQQRRKVCVIGDEVRKQLFAAEDPVGKEVGIRGTKYVVVGVLQKKDREILSRLGVLGGNTHGSVLLPASLHLSESREINYLEISANRLQDSDLAAKEAIAVLQLLHGERFQYSYSAMNHYIQAAENIIDIVSWIILVAVLLSIVVGGIGITNVMIISVVERTKEIGIRKALGASSKTIFLQFLIEATTLCLSAGIVGVLLGTAVALALVILTDKDLLFPYRYVFIALSTTIAAGILSGVFPAVKAAGLKPVEALRHE